MNFRAMSFPVLLCLCTVSTVSFGEDNEAEFARFLEEAQSYQISAGGKALELRPESLMNWSNPARRDQLGAIYVWEWEGRPQVVGTVFTYSLRDTLRTKHAFHSLSQDSLTASANGNIVWRPDAGGIVWKTFSDNPAVPKNSRLRELSMRKLSRRFTCILTSDKNETEELRVLPQPLYTYSAESQKVQSGAIFGFVTGTDPEALLIMEAFMEGADVRWRYGFARFHFWELEGRLDGETVWKVNAEPDQMRNRIGETQFQNRPYSTMLSSLRPLNE